MKRRTQVFIGMATIIATGAAVAGGAIASETASGLSYKDSVDVTFTLNPTVTISLSSSDLLISDLAPGSSSDSNIITVTTSSNASAGYDVYGTVGNSTYATTNLKHTSSTDTNVGIFAPMATVGTIGSGEWGSNYTSSVDVSSGSTPTWSDSDFQGYKNLPLYSSTDTGTQLIHSANAGSKAIGFKIGAKAKDAQIAGDYNNVINFVVTVNPIPDVNYMQDLDSATLAALLPNTGDTATVVDSRDEQEYTIAKLADGKYWMVENLNLAGGTALSSDDTAFDSSYALPTTNGWTKDGDKLVMPASATAGFSTDNYAYVYNSGNKTDCGGLNQNVPCYSYYSWDTATVGSGRTITADNTDAPYSICPKKWRLPTSRSTVAGNSDFYQLAVAYGMSSTVVNQSTANFYNNAGPGTTPGFLLAGYYRGGSFGDGGSGGYYWSATSASSAYARALCFYSGNVNSAGSYNRRYGFSVRCVFGG